MDAAPRAEHESEAVDLLLDRWPRAVINDRRRSWVKVLEMSSK